MPKKCACAKPVIQDGASIQPDGSTLNHLHRQQNFAEPHVREVMNASLALTIAGFKDFL
jgi:hypothetical protein